MNLIVNNASKNRLCQRLLSCQLYITLVVDMMSCVTKQFNRAMRFGNCLLCFNKCKACSSNNMKFDILLFRIDRTTQEYVF